VEFCCLPPISAEPILRGITFVEENQEPPKVDEDGMAKSFDPMLLLRATSDMERW